MNLYIKSKNFSKPLIIFVILKNNYLDLISEAKVGAAVQPDRQLLAHQGQRAALHRVFPSSACRIAAQR